MVPRTLQKRLSMFYLREDIHLAKNLYIVVVLLYAVLTLVGCCRCSSNEVSNQLDTGTCRSYGSNVDTTYPDAFGGYNGSEKVSRSSAQHHSHENICPPSDSLCFPSTLSRFLFDEIDAKLEELDASGDFSAGLKQAGSFLNRSLDHSIFNLLDGKIILCSLHQQNGFGQQTETSSYIRPLFDHKSHISESGEDAETVKDDSLDALPTPPTEIHPSVLDWGRKNMYDPSLAFLTLKNLDANRNLSIYHPYSSNLQFYSCNFSETELAPGEVASLCFVFFPTQLGLSSGQLVLQTSLGSFLIQAKGFAVESPFLIKQLSDLNFSSIERQRKSLSLFNPFNETLYVEEVNAWIFVSSGDTSGSSKTICKIHTIEDSSNYNISSAKDWLDVDGGVDGLPKIYMKPRRNWKIGPRKTEAIMELDFSQPFEGKIVGAFCLSLRSSANGIDTLMVPLDVGLSAHSTLDTSYVSASLAALVPCKASGSIIFALSVRNDSPHLLSVIKIRKVGESTNTFEIKSIQGLLLFPRSTTKVAILNYTRTGTPQTDINCKLLVLINDTRISQIEISCLDAINMCSGEKELDSALGYSQEIRNLIYIKGRQTVSYKAIDSSEADEIVLRNWRLQATADFMSVLHDSELLFPVVHVGNHCSQWIAVKNPSQEPVAMQLILNPGEVIDKCKTPELLLHPWSGMVLDNKLSAPSRFGFSLAKNAITEAFVHPYGSAVFGPILFQPSSRCEWRSSALIRSNLSGVEWILLRGSGGSLSMELLEESEPVQALEFKLKSPAKPKFSSSESTEKSYSCYQPLTKEVYAKNSGDLSMEVMRIDVSGSECGLDGFQVHNCKGFSLRPGESIRLQLSYQTDFSSATIQRNLELALATGIFVTPMKASLPMYMVNFCRRSIFWARVKKAMVMILVATSLLFLLACLFAPRLTAFSSQDAKSEKNSPSTVNGSERYSEEEEALIFGSSSKSPDCDTSAHDTSDAKYHMENNSLLSPLPKTRLSSELSKSLPVANPDVQDAADSRNLRVIIIGKDKIRRRRKKKSSGTGLIELSSSQSGNSTPSSPLSPVACASPKRPCPVSPVELYMENRNPFAQAPDQKCGDRIVTNLLDNKISSKCGNENGGISCQETAILTKKVASRAVLFPSASFPSAVRASPTWACHSPHLASTSTIALHDRAPGSKLQSKKSGEHEGKIVFEEKASVEENSGLEEKFTYDIWGDHLFGLTFMQWSEDLPSETSRAIESNSESFFVRGPPTLFTSSLLNTVSSDVEGGE